jgi:hypothetical protein
VTLKGIESLPLAEIVAADARFIKTLERQLGSRDAVVEVYRAWLEANESLASEVRADTWAAAGKWPKAFQAAQQAGLRNIGEGDAHFEMHLERQSA